MAIAHVVSAQGFASNNPANAGNMGAGATGTTKTFTYTATGTGNAVLFWVSMSPASTTSPTTCTLAATGWSFTQIGGIINGGTTGGVGAMFNAYAPNTSLATFTMTWNQSANFFNDLIDEFSGVDATTIVDATNSTTGTGTPTVSVTPVSANTMIWVPCNDSVTAVGSIGGTTAIQGANDTTGDWSEYRLLSGGAGSAQSCTFTGSGAYIIGAVAIKPPSTGASLFLPSLLSGLGSGGSFFRNPLG